MPPKKKAKQSFDPSICQQCDYQGLSLDSSSDVLNYCCWIKTCKVTCWHYCKLCKKVLSRQAVTYHATTAKHKQAIKATEEINNIATNKDGGGYKSVVVNHKRKADDLPIGDCNYVVDEFSTFSEENGDVVGSTSAGIEGNLLTTRDESTTAVLLFKKHPHQAGNDWLVRKLSNTKEATMAEV